MKKITKSELPIELNSKIIEILVEMAMEFPKTTFDWAEISEVLDERGQLMLILDKVQERQKAIEKSKEDLKSKEQKLFEENQRKRFYETLDPESFFGNMGEPETPQQYKDKYGTWPLGYDENGNKINK